MTGRGDGRLLRPYLNPTVTIALTLGLSSSTLSASSPLPFYIVVTARILTTPRPDSPITLQTHPTAIHGLFNRSFNDITSVKDPSKRIAIFPNNWPHYLWDSEDLRQTWEFVTIPSQVDGVAFTVSHEVPRERILAANLVPGERYRVSLTNKCLGTRWWAFKSEEQLQGVRLAQWRSKEERERDQKELDEIRGEIGRGEWPEDQGKEWIMEQDRFGDSPMEIGEDPNELTMVRENEMVEFEVI